MIQVKGYTKSKAWQKLKDQIKSLTDQVNTLKSENEEKDKTSNKLKSDNQSLEVELNDYKSNLFNIIFIINISLWIYLYII